MDFGSSLLLNDILSLFKDKAVAGINNLTPEALSLIMILAVIQIGMIGCLNFQEVKWQSILTLILKTGFFAFLVMNWEDICINQIYESFKEAGIVASGSNIAVSPSEILDKGIELTKNVLASIFKISGWSAVLGSLGAIFLKLILALLIIACFGFMAIQVLITTLEFYLVVALSVILLPFGVTRYTSFLSEKVIGAVFSCGIKLMVLTFILGISVPLYETWTELNGEEMAPLIKAGIGALTLALLTIHIPALAQGFLSGNPTLDGGQAISTGMRAGSAVASGGHSEVARMATQRLQRETGMVAAATKLSGGNIGGTIGNYATSVGNRGKNAVNQALFSSYQRAQRDAATVM